MSDDEIKVEPKKNNIDSLRRHRPLKSSKLAPDDKLALEVFYELRRIRHALERLSPPVENDLDALRHEEFSFEFALERLRSS